MSIDFQRESGENPMEVGLAHEEDAILRQIDVEIAARVRPAEV